MNVRRILFWVALLALAFLVLLGAAGTGALPVSHSQEKQTSPDGKGYRFDRDGWIYLHIEGEPQERGYQYGYLVAPELADHYDVYLQKENPGSRTVEGHYELDPFEYWPARLPYSPKGAVDGKVMDSELAADLSFWARWGNSSGMPFDADDFLAEQPQWSHLDGYLKDRPTQPWALFTAGEE